MSIKSETGSADDRAKMRGTECSTKISMSFDLQNRAAAGGSAAVGMSCSSPPAVSLKVRESTFREWHGAVHSKIIYH